jgi:hypothetical protein
MAAKKSRRPAPAPVAALPAARPDRKARPGRLWRAVELLRDRSPRAYQVALGLLLLILAALAGLVLYAGTLVQTACGNDVVVLLDGAWKVLHGYRPHADFYTPLGPLNYLLPALAMTVYGPDAFAISLANLALCVACVLGTWFVLKSRLTPLHCLALLSFAATEMLRSRHLFVDYDWIGYALLYNRQCYALLILVMPLLLLPRYAPTRKGEWQDAIAIGVLLGLVAFLKVSYFVAAMPLLAVGCVSRDWRWTARRLAGIAVGGLAVALPIFIYLRFDLLSIYRDLAMAYRARLGSESLLDTLSGQTGTLDVVALLCFATWAATRLPVGRVLTILCAIGALWLAQTLTIATNGKIIFFTGAHAATPLLLAAIIIPLEYAHRRCAPEARRRRLAVYCFAGLLGAALLGSTMAWEVKSLCFACSLRREGVARSERFHSRSLGSLVVTEKGEPGDFQALVRVLRARGIGPGTFGTFAEEVNDGLELLESFGTPSARVDALDFANPFPFGSGRPPSTSPSWWHAGVNISADAHPEAEQVFANTDIVMTPKYAVSGSMDTVLLLSKVYGAYLQEHFTKKAESPYWTLYVRKDNSSRD